MIYRFAYLFGNILILFPLWLLLFLKRKDLRIKLLTISLLAGIAGPISEFWFFADYWRPVTFNGWPVGIEDFLFGFFIGGIGSTIYTVIANKKFSNSPKTVYQRLWLLIPVIFLVFLAFHLLVSIFSLNSIYASIIIFILLSLIMVSLRRDLIVNSLISGLLMGLIGLVGYLFLLSLFPEIIQSWWKLENLSGIIIVNIPIEEILWASGWGMTAGPIYEFFTGLRYQKSKK